MRPLTAKDIMNTRVLSVRDDMAVSDLAAFLLDNELSGAPVRDVGGKLVGVVSVTDLARSAADGGEGVARDQSDPGFYVRGWDDKWNPEEAHALRVRGSELTVADIMTPAVYTVPEDTPVSDLAEIMIDSHIHRLMVTREGDVVGIVSSTDLLGLLVEKG